jgi:hypothetical protein
MNFQPRMLADGRVCCSEPYALCAECQAFHARHALGTSQQRPKPRRAGDRPKPVLRTTSECGCPKCSAARAQADAAILAAIAPKEVRKTKEEWERHFHIPPDGYAQALAKRGIVPNATAYDANDPMASYGPALAKRAEAERRNR